MASMAAREAEMLEPWRKNFPICKPYACHDKADAVRFLRELEEGCNGRAGLSASGTVAKIALRAAAQLSNEGYSLSNAPALSSTWANVDAWETPTSFSSTDNPSSVLRSAASGASQTSERRPTPPSLQRQDKASQILEKSCKDAQVL